MLLLFRSVVFIALLSPSLGISSHFPFLNEKRGLVLHGAIFDTFMPLEKQQQDSAVRHLVVEAKEKSQTAMLANDKVRFSLFLLDNLRLLHSRHFLKFCYRVLLKDQNEVATVTNQALMPVREFLKGLNVKKHRPSIADLSMAERHALFAKLIQSDVNLLRQVAYYLRILYSLAIYDGALGRKISGLIAASDHKMASVMPDLKAFTTDLKFDRHKRRIQGHLDALIVGSGPAGSVAAHELQKNGLRVMVVESGPLIIPGAINTTGDTQFMESNGIRSSEDGSLVLLNGNAVGGGTTVNLDMSFPPYLPMVRHRFHQWRDSGLIPEDLWTDDEINRAYTWVMSMFMPRTVHLHEVNANNAILMRGAEALGIPPRRYQLNQYRDNSSPYEVYKKKSSFDRLLIPAMLAKDNPLTLLHNCRVNKVLIKNGKAYGVECVYEPKSRGLGLIDDLYGFDIKPKTKITIHADRVILAAGNLGTSAVLLRSGVKNANIGRGFVAHPFIPLVGRFKEVIKADVGEPSTIFVDHFMPTDRFSDRPGFLLEAGLGRMGMWASLLPGTPRQVLETVSDIDHLGGFSVMVADTPNDNNRVELGPNGQILVHYRLLDQDRQRLIEGLRTSVEILFAAGATSVSFNSHEYPLVEPERKRVRSITPDMDLDHVFSGFRLMRNQTLLVAAHMMGGNKLGVSEMTSVVNKDYQVWGVSDLYVIDSSIFPGSVGANPMQTIYTCAKIFVDRFLANWRRLAAFAPHDVKIGFLSSRGEVRGIQLSYEGKENA